MRLSPAILGGAALALLVSARPACADLIPWTYNWSSSPSELPADAPGTGHISFTDEAPRNVVGNSDIVATNLRTVSTATDGNPDKFTNAAYKLSLSLVDSTSGQGGTLAFTGVLNGTVTAGSSNLKNSFTGDTTQTIQLGDNLYTVTIGPYSPPGPPDSTSAGTISAYASVTVQAVGSIATVPEPPALLLASLALPVFVICLRRSQALDSSMTRAVCTSARLG
jgi:hypothetical protein